MNSGSINREMGTREQEGQEANVMYVNEQITGLNNWDSVPLGSSGSVLVSCSCYNKYHKCSGLKGQMYYLIVL